MSDGRPALPNIDPDTGRELDIVAMLERQRVHNPRRTFLRTPAGSLTYAQAHDRTARLAGALARRGVGRGTSVAVLMETSVEQVLVWFALARLGALHVPVNPALFGERLRAVLDVAGCRLAVVDPALAAALREVFAEPALTCDELLDGGEPVPAAAADPLDPATLLFTSGTTGRSKACILSRRYLAAQGAAHARNFALHQRDVLYCPFPLYHVDAATLTVVAALSVGATAALTKRFSASRFWDEVRSCGATVFDFMGATLTILWKQPPSARDRDHTVRLAWGVPMPEWQREWEARFGFPLYQVYGSTDAGVPVYDPIDGSRRAGAAGRVTELFDVRLDAGGEILVRGRHPGLTMSGYYGMPEATAETIDDEGWVRTGDLGTLDDDGFLTFAGRVSDSIRRRGENISAFEVEELIVSHPDVVEAAAVGVPSELTEEDVKVFVVVRDAAALSAAQLHGYCLERAPRYMVPRYYEFVAELPKTPTAKVEKYRLRSAVRGDAAWDAEQ